MAEKRAFSYNKAVMKPGCLKFLLIPWVCFLSGCAPTEPAGGPVSQYALGTVCLVNLYGQGRPELYAKTFERLRELENIFSANREGTDLGRVNQNAGLAPVKVRPELIFVLEKALEYAEKSGGMFDPSIGPLVKLWGIGTDGARIPGEEEIRQALDLVSFRDIEIDPEGGTVFLKRPGMALDLGAIAKGYAADEAAELLRREGASRGIIDLGGDIFALGEKKEVKSLKSFMGDFFSRLAPGGSKPGGEQPDESYWRIGIQDPRESRGVYIGILTVKDKSVVTSGPYERFFEEGGKRYHHILSAENGYPVENGLMSVTIIADNSIDADALSTAAFALGWERGRDLIASSAGAEGIFIFEDLTVALAGEAANGFTLTAAEYRLLPEF